MKNQLKSLGDTKRLTLRLPAESDADALGALWADPAVTEHVGGPRDASSVSAYYADYARRPDHYLADKGDRWWIIEIHATGELAGLCGLLAKEVEEETAIELDYFVWPAFWGRGYATEAAQCVMEHAFQTLDLPSLIAVIDPHNARSEAVARRLGMRVERESLRSDGVVRRIYRRWAREWRIEHV